ADENLVAARGCPRSLHIEGATNRNAAHAFEVSLYCVSALFKQDAFRHHAIFQERRGERVRTCLHRQADLEIGLRVSPRRRVYVRPPTSRREGEQLKPLIVEPQIKLALPPGTQNLIGSAPLQAQRTF